MLTPESIASPTAEKKMIGSVFVCEADSLQTVRDLMESDVYYTSGVVSHCALSSQLPRSSSCSQWDKEKLVVVPLALVNFA